VSTATRNLPHIVSWRARTGQGDWGDAAFSAPVTIRAYVQEELRRVRSPGGDELTATTAVKVVEPASVGDRLTLEGQTEEQDVVARESINHRGRTIGYWCYL
jgi:hypothetical protein